MEDRITKPVLLIAFNRPDIAQLVFNQIKKVKPTQFYLAVDGPREDRPGEAEKCIECQSLVNQVDWDCEVHTLFRTENVGCGFGPAGAISWAFETAEELIVLEDDCLPSLSFFFFCDELLSRYKTDKRIWIISGLSIHSGEKILGEYDYTFAHIAHTWGWATWRDRWNEFDMYMKDVPEFLSIGGSYNVYHRRIIAKKSDKRIETVFNLIDKEVTHSWDTQWAYTRLKNGGLNIVPKLNMITNIGATNGTHSSGGSISMGIKANELSFPIKHPHFVICNEAYDSYHYSKYIYPSFSNKLNRYLFHPFRFFRRISEILLSK